MASAGVASATGTMEEMTPSPASSIHTWKHHERQKGASAVQILVRKEFATMEELPALP